MLEESKELKEKVERLERWVQELESSTRVAHFDLSSRVRDLERSAKHLQSAPLQKDIPDGYITVNKQQFEAWPKKIDVEMSIPRETYRVLLEEAMNHTPQRSVVEVIRSWIETIIEGRR